MSQKTFVPAEYAYYDGDRTKITIEDREEGYAMVFHRRSAALLDDDEWFEFPLNREFPSAMEWMCGVFAAIRKDGK